jgi:hypothetical protein
MHMALLAAEQLAIVFGRTRQTYTCQAPFPLIQASVRFLKK